MYIGQCSKACSGLEDVLPDLLELSVLIPAAPWVSDEATYILFNLSIMFNIVKCISCLHSQH